MNPTQDPESKTDPEEPPGNYRPKSTWWLLLWLLVFGLVLAWRAQNLDAFGLSNDEGAHLMWARLIVDGYPLYRETQAVQAPLFLEWVALAFRIGGQTIQAGRWAMLVGFGLLAGTLSWLAHRAAGWRAALAALVLLGLAPLVFTFSRLVMAEVPATGLAVLALALLFVYLDRGRQAWLIASGLALGLSFITKALNPFIVFPIGLLLLVRSNLFGLADVVGLRHPADQPWRSLLLDGLLWSLGCLIPMGLLWLLYDPVALVDQLIAFRADLRAAIPGSWSETWMQFAGFFTTHWGFWLLAGGGIISTLVRFRIARKPINSKVPENVRLEANASSSREPSPINPTSLLFYPLVWFVWLLAGSAMLLWHTPLFPHHFIILLPPLILLGAGFITTTITLWPSTFPTPAPRANNNESSQIPDPRSQIPDPKSQISHPTSHISALAFSILALAAAFNLPAIISANQDTVNIVTGGREAQALDLLQSVSEPDAFIMGDSQLLIFMAGRRTPPPLGDVALVAIKAGRQTSARMIDLTRAYHAPAVVQWSLRLPWLPDYLDWVEANYLARREWDGDHIIYFVPAFPTGETVPNEIRVRLGLSLTLVGYDLGQTPPVAGHDLDLKVYWQTDESLPQDYTVFTQLLDETGTLVTGWDSRPLSGYFPTTQWPPDQIITDLVQLPLPADLPAGQYTLITGLYILETLERLATPTGSDHLVLTTLSISNSP
jgi:hypothetical protein